MELEYLERDPKVVEEGQWVDEIPEFGDLRLKVRGMMSVTVLERRAALERAVPRNERDAQGNLKPTVGERILGQVLHEVVLMDWDNLTYGGQPVPYDKKRASEYCTEAKWRRFADAVVWAANVVDRGYRDSRESLAKNSLASSSGKAGGATAQKD